MNTNKISFFLFILFSIFYPKLNFSQFSIGGSPYSFNDTIKNRLLQKNIANFALPFISNEAEKAYVKTHQKYKKSNVFGKYINVQIDFFSEASQIFLSDSSKLFVLKISSSSSEGMQFYFDRFYLPVGSKLYFYNENKSFTLGAFTSDNNRENGKFGTKPILGDNIYIEYFEPFGTKETCELKINKVVHIFRKNIFKEFYKNERDDPFIHPSCASQDCEINTKCLDQYQFLGWDQEVKSIVMIIAALDNLYIQTCTGTLINVAGGYSPSDYPYLLACAHSLLDSSTPYEDVEDWVFLFGFEDPDCNGNYNATQYLTSNNSVFGAELLSFDANYPDYSSDHLLCRLNESVNTINSNIDVSYAGWDHSEDAGQVPLIWCFHHPMEDTKKFSFSDELNEINILYNPNCDGYNAILGNNWWETKWDLGIVEKGSSGAPLFNAYHKIIGHCFATSSNCVYEYEPPCIDIGPDKTNIFGKFSTAWENGDFEYYLDPYSMNVSSVNTFTPNFCGNGICEPECGEIFPDCPDCPDPSGGGSGGSICWAPVSDGFKINGSGDGVVFICPDYTDIVLTPLDDDCVFNIGRELIESSDSNCEYEESLYCNWEGWLWWKKCNCWHWLFYISIYECDNELNTIGNEYGGWFNQLQTSPCLLSLSVLDEINQLGIILEAGKYYKLKIATSPWGSGWTESTKYFYMLPESIDLNGENANGDYFALQDIILQNTVIEDEQNVTIVAGNSIVLGPNSSVEYGSNFLASIFPNIISWCASSQFEDFSYNTDLIGNNVNGMDLKTTENIISIESNILNLFPNPTTGKINIILNNYANELISIELRQISGQMIINELQEYNDKIILDLSLFPNGIYLLTLKTSDKVFNEKIVLQ